MWCSGLYQRWAGGFVSHGKITIRQRFLVAYSVKSFPQDSLGFPWDKDAATGEDKRPIFGGFYREQKQCRPDGRRHKQLAAGAIFFNVESRDVGNTVTFDLILTDEPWAFVLRDWDGADENNITNERTFSLVMGRPSIRCKHPLSGTRMGTGFFHFFFQLLRPIH